MAKRSWLAKFRESAAGTLGEDRAASVLACVEHAEALPARARARAIAAAVDAVDRSASPEEARRVLQSCSCDFAGFRIAQARALYEGSAGMHEFAARLAESGLLAASFTFDGREFLITQCAYRPDLAAANPNDLFAWRCHCGSIARPLKRGISPTICECGAGYFRQLFEGVFQMPVEVQVRQSLVRGDDLCVMAVLVPTALRDVS